MTDELKVQILSNFKIFQHVSKKDLTLIAARLDEKTILPHTTFIKEGNSDTDLYFIVSGFVRIYNLHESGKEITIAMRMPGEIIGEMPLIDDRTRSASAETIEKTQLFVLQKKDFLSLYEKYPRIIVYFLKILSVRLREALHAQKIVSFERLEDRTYHILKMLSPHFAASGVTLTHEQLSILVNATQPRVTEALNILQRDKKISLSRKKILLN